MSRCCIHRCNRWASGSTLCKECAAIPAAVQVSQLAAKKSQLLQMPTLYDLIATKPSTNMYHLPVDEGDDVQVLQILEDKSLLCRVRKSQNSESIFGYLPREVLATKDEIYEMFIVEEDEKLLDEIDERQKSAERAAEDYERGLRNNIKQKAEDDRKRRAVDAEQRKIKAAQMQKELEETRAREAKEAAERENNLKQWEAKIAAQQKAEADKRIAEAQSDKAKWDAQKKAADDKVFLASLPQWKRDQVLKNRASNS
eukprot:m.40822 g.40822  ORF g.40822 m.40822 type:complete len:256 (+) comp18625_c0_seq1:3-770(+)